MYDNTPDKKPDSHLREGLSTLAIIVIAPLLALFMINFVFQTYEVDGPSMETTLSDDDRLIVSKTQRTLARLTNDPFIPDRYDIIIFKHRGDFGLDKITDKQLIKRVIGLPGDRVVIDEGLVTIYNDQHPEGFLVDREGPQAETVSTTAGNLDITVGKNEVFVLGDNRDNSLDSRNIGSIRSQNIVGELMVRVYPFDQARLF